MAKLTETQDKALEALRAEGTLYSGGGVSAATIRVLARLGLVEVESDVQTWFSRRSGRNHSQCDWSATIKN